MKPKSHRPFKEGDVLELSGEMGTVARDEADGFVIVRCYDRSETWAADHCVLIVRPLDE